jgi:signal transduction histidine kinase
MNEQQLAEAIRSARILIVDDIAANIEVLTEALELDGYCNIESTQDPAKGLALLERQAYDLVLLDMRMPEIDGHEFIRRLKARKSAEPVPILMLTAQTDADTRRQALALGARGFLTKAFELWELLHRVCNILNVQMLFRHTREMNEQLEERVARRTGELEAANRGLDESLRTASAARRQAEEANRALTDFLGNMSHELRTPLNAILGFAQILADGSHSAIARQRYPEYAKDILVSGTHLLRIIDTLLDAAKLQGGQYQLEEERVSVRECVETCLRMMTGHPDGAGITFERHIAAGLPSLHADRRLVMQMLLNLLSNAVKFTKAGGTVRVEVKTAEDGGLMLGVHDTGIGIAEEDLAKMQRPFRRGSQDIYVRDGGGTGLGLPLVILMARLHGGDFALRSKVGVGTSAIISLPAERLVTTQGQTVGA